MDVEGWWAAGLVDYSAIWEGDAQGAAIGADRAGEAD